jgi:lysophospholipase L1-like esterase
MTVLPRPAPAFRRSRRARATLSVLASLAIGAASLVGPGPLAEPADAKKPRHPLTAEYVALGDSFAAGPGVLPFDTSDYDTCARSLNDYPHLLAERLGVVAFRDVTCSGATTWHFTQPQGPMTPFGAAAPPQFDALTESTTLVTLTIGGNDAGLVAIATSCLNPLPAPAGTSCKTTMTAGGVDRGAQAVDAVRPLLEVAVEEIHARSPHATVVLTSYARYLPPGGCYPLVPGRPEDADYVQGLVNRLGRLTAAVAAEHDALYVDFIKAGAGHTACDPLSNWVTGVVPMSLDLMPMHPTLLGEQNFARILAERLG